MKPRSMRTWPMRRRPPVLFSFSRWGAASGFLAGAGLAPGEAALAGGAGGLGPGAAGRAPGAGGLGPGAAGRMLVLPAGAGGLAPGAAGRGGTLPGGTGFFGGVGSFGVG